MDQKQLQEKIAEYYVKLPEDLKVFFAGMSWLTNIQEVSLKYTLNPEQIEVLTTETTLLLLCIVSTEDYIKTIESELKLPKETFDKVLDEIGEGILKDTYQKLDEGFLNNLEILDKENKAEMQYVPLPPYKKQEEVKVAAEKPSSIFDRKPIIKTTDEIDEQKLVDQTKKDVNFLAQKLNSPTLTKTIVSDQSLPNINKQATVSPLAKSHDPYREGVEL